MNSVIIGILSGFLVIATIAFLKRLHKPTMYALILSGIGFLYVGFTWTDKASLIMNCLQAIFFLFLAYFGVKKNFLFLIAGYFLHGSWDLLYNLFPNANLIPPNYDLFCLSIDFTFGFYLLILKYLNVEKMDITRESNHNDSYILKNEL
ncbi:MAG: DUF6010 family protein [Chitinophagaceae bacterium]